jgi:hypothetical protein
VVLGPFTELRCPLAAVALDPARATAHASVMGSKTRWRRAAAGWAVFILVSVALYQGIGPLNRGLQVLGRYEAVHIVAHGILYGTLSALCVLWLRRGQAAVLITVCVGAAQEALQCAFAHRLPGAPELFDIMVDAAAALGAALIVLWQTSRPAVSDSMAE